MLKHGLRVSNSRIRFGVEDLKVQGILVWNGGFTDGSQVPGLRCYELHRAHGSRFRICCLGFRILDQRGFRDRFGVMG